MSENIIILTGGSRGIGHATSKKFWEEGWRVITCSRSEVAPQCPWEKNKTDHFQIDLEDLDDLRKKVKRVYFSTVESIELHGSLKSAIASARIELEATKKSTAAGVRKQLDVLISQQKALGVEREFITAKLNIILYWLNLNLLMGNLDRETITVVNNFLVSS